jgi:hypothetical protein
MLQYTDAQLYTHYCCSVCTHNRPEDTGNVTVPAHATVGALHKFFDSDFLERNARFPMALLPLVACVRKLNIVVWGLNSKPAEGQHYVIREYGSMQAVFRGNYNSATVHHLLHYTDTAAKMSLYDGLVKKVPMVECNSDSDAE